MLLLSFREAGGLRREARCDALLCLLFGISLPRRSCLSMFAAALFRTAMHVYIVLHVCSI